MKRWFLLILMVMCMVSLVEARTYTPTTGLEDVTMYKRELWTTSKHTGTEKDNFRITISDKYDRNAQVCFNVRPESRFNAGNLRIFNDKTLQFYDAPRISLAQDTRYCVSGWDYYRVGLNTVVTEYVNESRLTFNFTDENHGIHHINYSCEGVPIGDINVSYDENYKHSGTGTFEGIKNCSIKINSTVELEYYLPNIYKHGTTDIVTHNFQDVCLRTFDNQSADCRYTTWQDNGYYFLQADFISDKNIDPTVGINNVSTQDAIYNNTLGEAHPYTHIELNDSDLVLYYSFDIENKSNKIILDNSMYNHHGTSGHSWHNTSGYIGGSRKFNGNGDIDHPDFVVKNYTMMGWVWDEERGGYNGLFECDAVTGGGYFGINRDGLVRVCQTNATDHSINTLIGSGQPTDKDNWTHLATVAFGNETNQSIIFYKNGEPRLWRNYSNGIGNTIIKQVAYTHIRFNGSIDEVMVWNRSMTASEIKAIYNNQSARFPDYGLQTFKVLNFSQNGSLNRINITTNTSILGDSELKARVREWNETNYDDNTEGSVDSDVILHWHLDNNSAYGENNTVVYDYSANANNGTVTSSPIPNATGGQYAGGFELDGVDDCIYTPSAFQLSNDTWTMSLWVKIYNLSSDTSLRNLLYAHVSSNSNEIFRIALDATNDRWDARNDYGIVIQEDFSIPHDTWANLLFTYDYPNQVFKFYENNVEIADDTSFDQVPSNVGLFSVGARDTSNYFLNASVDEVIIWNKTLTRDEITEYYIKGKLKYENPTEWQTVTNGTNQVTQHNLTLNGTHILTEFNYSSGANNFFTPYLYDTLEIESWAEQVTDGLPAADTTPPTFTNLQTNDSSNTYTLGVLQLNGTINDASSNISHYRYTHNDTATGAWENTTLTASTGVLNSVNTSINITIDNIGINGGTFGWYLWGNDTINNSGYSAVQTVTIQKNNSPPTTPTIQYPTSGQNYSDIPYINYSSSDLNNDTITYQIYINDTLNTSLTTNLTDWNASDGYYELKVTANDGTVSSSNSSTTPFRVDSTAPSFSNNQTNNTAPSYGQVIRLNITITDDTADSYRFFWNYSGNYLNDSSNTYTSGSVISTTKTINIVRNNYVCWGYWANDSLDQASTSSLNCFTVGNSAPSAPTIHYPVDTQSYDNVTQLNYSANDLDFDSLTYYSYINGTLNMTLTTNTSTWNISYGYYQLNVTAYDGTSSSVNTSIHFTISETDTTAPTFTDDENNWTATTQSNNSIGINITLNDGVGGSFWVFAWNESATWTNITNGTWSGTSQTVNVSQYVDINNNNTVGYRFYANDTSDNWGVSTTTTFTTYMPPTGNNTLYLNWTDSSLGYAAPDRICFVLSTGDICLNSAGWIT